MRFKNKVALVTGGGRDIGKAISLKLASEGAHVIVNYSVSDDASKQTVSEITAAGGKANPVQGRPYQNIRSKKTFQTLFSLRSVTSSTF